MTKDAVREVAADLGLRTATKPDSQDVCFITSSSGRSGFLADRLDLHPGEVVDSAGREVGRVDAVELVTVGQRKGLGLAGGDERRFAVAVDVPRRRVVVGSESDLDCSTTPVTDLAWVGAPIEGELLVQTSAHGRPAPATLAGTDVRWREPHRRVARGQSVVLYDGDEVVGSGIAG